MNVLIAGCGRVGAQLAMLLSSDNNTVTIMDRESSSFSRLNTAFNGTALVGDCTAEGSLREAGIEEADAFVVVTGQDNSNIMSAQLAKHVFNTPKIVCLLEDPARADFYQTLGLETVSPTFVFAQMLKEKVIGK